MSVPKVMALRFTTEGTPVVRHHPHHPHNPLDPAPGRKLSVSYGSSEGYGNFLPADADAQSSTKTGADAADRVRARMSNAKEGSGVGEAALRGNETTAVPQPSSSSSSTNTSRASSIADNNNVVAAPISRSLSMPSQSQLSQLRNVRRPSAKPNSHPSSSSSSSQVDELSVELADSIQLAIQTLLQVTPPQVLDAAKEQFSACALSVPTNSVAALFTAMKNINYISHNLSALCDNLRHEDPWTDDCADSKHHREFDIGETLQCLGDVLSGAAAQRGVDLVIYHGDTGIRHVYVSADEAAISFALSHVIRQVLNTAEKSDSIELGLLVGTGANSAQSENQPPADTEDDNDTLQVTIRISHRFFASDQYQGDSDYPNNGAPPAESRSKPYFSTLLFRRILRQIGGKLKSDLPPPETFCNGCTYDFELRLERVTTLPSTPTDVPGQDLPIEPTLEQLAFFGDTLKGRRVTFYASAKGSFAHHLTSYLTAWGMDVTHVSPDGQVDGSTELPGTAAPQASSPVVPTTEPRLGSPELIFIDDDVDILKERLNVLWLENQPQTPALTPKKRPSLSTNQRTKSSQQVARVVTLRPPNEVVILHFTCLSNYKRVKAVVQTILVSYGLLGTPLPEIMIIPKPVGPRRFLTALHTAIMKPTVDPFFVPIATSPMSPSLVAQPIPFSSISSPTSDDAVSQLTISSSQGSTASMTASQSQPPLGKTPPRPHASRTNSERSVKALDAITANLPPSPLGLADNAEYFPGNAQQLGNSPSSGLVIQSPDGQTAGIFFHPRSKNASRNPSSVSIDTENVQPGVSPGSRKPSASRILPMANKEVTMSFSSLYEAPEKNVPPPNKPDANSDIVSFDSDSELTTSPTTIVPSPTTLQLPTDGITASAPEDSPKKPATPSPSPSIVRPPISRGPSDESQPKSRPDLVVVADGSPATPGRRGLHKKTASAENKDPFSASPKQKAKMAASADGNVVPPISVLIVDDNPINQTILSTFMRRKKIKYDLASNGQEAVQKWRTGGFHLILMDIQMPIMDGIQATKEIRRLEELDGGYPPILPTQEGRTPSDASAASSSTGSSSETKAPNSPYHSSVIIVALTASSLQSDRVAALAAGCNDFLTKPVSLLWLNNKIIEWGSIKALQMWADIRPEAVRTMAQQAKAIAERLHVPKGRMTPVPAKRSTSAMDESAAALALASSAGPIPNLSATAGRNASSLSESTSFGLEGCNTNSSTTVTSSAREDSDAAGLTKSVDSNDDRPKMKSPKPLQGDKLWLHVSRAATPVRPSSTATTPHPGPFESVNTRDGSNGPSVVQPPPPPLP